MKYPPEGAKFITDRRYVIPDNSYISTILRRKVRSLRKKYERKDPRKNLRIKVDNKDFQFRNLGTNNKSY